MKSPRGCSPSDGGTLQKQAMPMDLDVYWCDGSVRERWKQDVPSTITRSISGLDSQNRSRTKDLVISIINNQHPLKSWAVWLFPGTSLEKETPRGCPLERDDISGQMTGRSQLQLAHALERNEPRADRLLCLPRTDCADSGIWTDRAGLVGPFLLHRSCRGFHISLGQNLERSLEPLRAKKPEVPRAVFRRTWSDLSTTAGLEDRPGGTTGSISVDRGAVATRFFDVLTARVFQEKKP